jgi:8-amino-7-oxononanoate synthase
MSWDLQSQAAQLKADHLWRELRTLDSAQGPVVQIGGREVVNFSSNDYLGLADSAELSEAMQEGVELYGAGSGSSRLVCGTMKPHAELEAALAAFKRTEAALTFSSGYAVALGTIPALVGSGDTIILDKLSHACLVDAARLSGATIRVFPHNHLEKLRKLLETAKGRVLVVTEAIFSMDGDACPLAEIVELKERHGAWLLLDEAHAVGVIGPQGRGLTAALGLENRVELQMGTLSKALGLSGGYLAASRQVIDLLINRARSLIYSTASPPCLAHAARAALDIVSSSEGDRRRATLHGHIRQLSPGAPGISAIVPRIMGDETRAMEASARLLESGFLIPAIRYPTVARGSARLRITASAAHQPEQIQSLLQCLTHLGLSD